MQEKQRKQNKERRTTCSIDTLNRRAVVAVAVAVLKKRVRAEAYILMPGTILSEGGRGKSC